MSANSSRTSFVLLLLLLTACEGSQQSRTHRALEYRRGLDAYAIHQYPEALAHFHEAAERGNATAQYYTGLMYANGQGAEQDYRKAAAWYQKAAALDQPDATLQLARLYVMGLGVDFDIPKAIGLFDRAAKLYQPGKQRDEALEQKTALEALLKERAATPPQ
jgi:TPR repeat protein